jgi:hypothetical protein
MAGAAQAAKAVVPVRLRKRRRERGEFIVVAVQVTEV